MAEKLDPLTPLGRRVLTEIQSGEAARPSKPHVDFDYLQQLGHVAGNPFYEQPEPPDTAA